ncbi:MAG: hypothetical protein QOJ26_864 [Thermoplasmata archaeon]|nr:hypothetical protein [Thermoplasmata archaeon]
MTHEERYLLTLLPEAPGLKSLEVRITVDWAISQTSGNGASARMVVAADYRTETNVVVPRKLMVCDCNRFDFEVELTNLGNARTQYNFEVLEPPNGGAWDIQMPDPVVLDSPNSGGDHTSEKVVISVFADGGSGKGSYTIQILVASADQPDKKGEPIEVHLLANKEGLLDKATPGPGGPMLLVGLVGVALFSRRRA